MTLCCLNSSRCAPDMSETLRTIVVLYILYRNCGHSFTRFGLSQWPFILVLHLALHAAGDHRASRVMRTAFDKQKESNLMSRLVHCYLYHSCRAQRDDLGGLQSAGHCWMIFDKFCVNEDNVSSIYIYCVCCWAFEVADQLTAHCKPCQCFSDIWSLQMLATTNTARGVLSRSW